MTSTPFQKLKPTAIHPFNALGAGMRLQEFEIRTVIGEGGFGIVYHAFDTLLERDVAIKEYLPVSHAVRANDGSVVARSERHAETFAKGLMYFLSEARMLARFKHAALVEVFRFWEENGTAYMVMPYYRGNSLNQLIQAGFRVKNESALLAFLEPLMQGLRHLHEASCFHRDIATDNILMLESGEPVLLDFGAARSILVGEAEHSTVILKPGFAPVEQYSNDRQLAPQGAWTDLYALCAVAYQLITGDMPVMSVARIMRDPLVPLITRAPAGFSAQVLRAVDCGMKVDPASRPQSVAEFSDLLRGLAAPGSDCAAPDVDRAEEPVVAAQSAVAEEPATESGAPLMHLRADGPPAAAQRSVPVEPDSKTDNVPPPVVPSPSTARRAKPPGRSAWPRVLGAGLVVGALIAGRVVYQSMSEDQTSVDNGVALASTDRHAMPFGIQATQEGDGAEPQGDAGSQWSPDPGSAPTQEMAEHDEVRTSVTSAPGGLLTPEPAPSVGAEAVTPRGSSESAHSALHQATTAGSQQPGGEVVDAARSRLGEGKQGVLQDTGMTPSITPVAGTPGGEGVGMEEADVTKQDLDYGVVEVSVAPWGNVYLNGQLVGVAPPRVQVHAGLGANELTISNETHPPRTVSLFVEPGKNYRIRHDFTKQ